MLNPFSVTSHCSYANKTQSVLILKAAKCILCLLQSSAASLIPGKCSYPSADEKRSCEFEKGRKEPSEAQWPWLTCLLPRQLFSRLCSPLCCGQGWGSAGHWARAPACPTHVCWGQLEPSMWGQLEPSMWGQQAQDKLQV